MKFWKTKNDRLLDDPATLDAIRDYLELDWGKKHKDILEQRYVVFDLETTGLDPKADRILSFAFITVDQGAIFLKQRLEGFIGLERDAAIKASDIHHITKTDMALGLPEPEFALEALKLIGNSALVGHHVAFDVACLNAVLETHFGMSLQNATVDTAQLGARLENPLMGGYGGKKAFKGLDALCKEYGVQPEARHSASGDALTTAMLFLKLMKKAKARGIRKLFK